MPDRDQMLRDLPAVDHLVERLDPAGLSRTEMVNIARAATARARNAIQDDAAFDLDQIAHDLVLVTSAARARPMINATGVLLHTNLGRAPLAPEAVAAASMAGANYSNVEFDTISGSRGSRGANTIHLIRTLTGAEDALVLNNNAASLFLVLAALGNGKAVPVSRGEMIEIGGSYRLPELMATSGARLLEVGTTNRTRPDDYATALQINDCAMLLKVHRANYEISGFAEEAHLDDLLEVGHAAGVPVVFDIGSGLLDAEATWLEDVPDWLAGEPGVAQAIESGADLALFSGDKLVGGPQAGIVAGKRDLIEILRGHPIRRALRVDGSTDAALAATLQKYVDGQAGDLPFWKMATLTPNQLRARIDQLAQLEGATVEEGYSMVGGGSAPSARIPGPIVRFHGKQAAFEHLLADETPVVARRDRGDLIVDVRCVIPRQDDDLVAAVGRCL